MRYCGNGKYCCGTDPACCRGDQLDILTLGEPKIYATAGVYSSASSDLATLVQAPPSSATSVAPSMSSPTSPASETETNGTSLNTKVQSKGGESQVLAVGLGVGLSLGLVIVFLVAGGVWWIRKIQKQAGSGIVEELDAQEVHRVELEDPGKVVSATELYDKSTYSYRIEMPALELK